MTTTTTAKSFFEEGDKPTEAEFGAVIDMIGGRTAIVASVTAMQSMTTAQIADFGSFYLEGYASAGDGGEGIMTYFASAAVSANGGTVFAIGSAATGRIIRQTNVITPQMFGAKGDGATDDSTAFFSAITAAYTAGVRLFIPYTSAGYAWASVVLIPTLSGPLTITGENNVKIKFTGSAGTNGFMLRIGNAVSTDLSGHPVHFENFLLDGDNKISAGLRLQNHSASMAAANIDNADLDSVQFKNFLMAVGNTNAATGCVITGGFERVTIDNCLAKQIDRATGAGTTGVVGCIGIAVSHNGINAYAKNTVARNTIIDTITNNETTGTGDDADCDGFVVFGPDPSTNGNKPVGHTVVFDKITCRDCKGRGIKTQLNFTTAINCQFYHDLEQGITNQHDIDAQQGSLTSLGNVFFINEKSGGGTTMGTAYSCIAATNQGIATAGNNESGGVIVSNNTVICSVPVSVDDAVPFFITIASSVDAEPFRSLKFTDNTLLGSRFQRFAKVDLGTDESDLIIRGNTCGLSTSLLQIDTIGNFSEVNMVISENVQTGSTLRALIEDATGFQPHISGHSNRGFKANRTASLVSNEASEVFRPLQIGGQDRAGGGTFSVQSAFVVDDASNTFAKAATSGRCRLVSTGGELSTVDFSYDGNSLSDRDAGFATDVEFGSSSGTVNQNTDGKLNIWLDTGTNEVNIKNRLASTFQFTLFIYSSD